MHGLVLLGERLELRSDATLHWPRRRTLVIADLHLGKAAAFRSRGLPVPEQTTGSGLDRLATALRATRAQRLVILGDLIHARSGRSPAMLEAVARWRAAHRGLEVVVTRGNHDRGAGDPPATWGFTCVAELREDPFVFAHQPPDGPSLPSTYAITGHVHPVALLTGPGGDRLRAPCFWLGADHAVLPAFGAFTGGHEISPAPGDRVFVTGPSEVIEIAVHQRARPRGHRVIPRS